MAKKDTGQEPEEKKAAKPAGKKAETKPKEKKDSRVKPENDTVVEAKPADEKADEAPETAAPEKSAKPPKVAGHARPPRRIRHGKRYDEAAKLVEVGKLYPLHEAAKLVKQTSPAKFDGTVEIHIRLGIDPRQAEQGIRGTVKLPAGTGKQRKVLAFVPSAQQAAVKKAGADFVSDEATLKKIKDGWTGFDVTVATPDQMTEVAKLGKTLGPKGLMPNPKTGTVTDKPAEAIGEVKKGTIEFRVAKDATIHAGVGKVSFTEEDIAANVSTYYQAVRAAKPEDAKGTYIKTVTLASTMGPGIKLDPDSIGKVKA